MTIKIVIFIVGLLLGTLVTAMFARARSKGDEAKMAIMRNCLKKQDDAIRRKQARIDELEREAKRTERKKG